MPIKGKAASNLRDMATPLVFEKKRNVAPGCEAIHSMLANAPRKAAKNTEGGPKALVQCANFRGLEATSIRHD
jgi:hypothetical protein